MKIKFDLVVGTKIRALDKELTETLYSNAKQTKFEISKNISKKHHNFTLILARFWHATFENVTEM